MVVFMYGIFCMHNRYIVMGVVRWYVYIGMQCCMWLHPCNDIMKISVCTTRHNKLLKKLLFCYSKQIQAFGVGTKLSLQTILLQNIIASQNQTVSSKNHFFVRWQRQMSYHAVLMSRRARKSPIVAWTRVMHKWIHLKYYIYISTCLHIYIHT